MLLEFCEFMIDSTFWCIGLSFNNQDVPGFASIVVYLIFNIVNLEFQNKGQPNILDGLYGWEWVVLNSVKLHDSRLILHIQPFASILDTYAMSQTPAQLGEYERYPSQLCKAPSPTLLVLFP
ncbi:hypothetical protein RF11_12125 [Thelohanellus kitauei]|uniref:Uncharacterized protein n=1 Tax=Thelohanellus kitauei TaxID=669202 RepID=A0A0C2I5B6_THEKT|nr:hypothetical protein RF11_12125 [Thelohanellus kitauei]